MTFRIITVPTGQMQFPLIADVYSENDAEEIGAALALAGFHVQVWAYTKLLHEFFPTEPETKGSVDMLCINNPSNCCPDDSTCCLFNTEDR